MRAGAREKGGKGTPARKAFALALALVVAVAMAVVVVVVVVVVEVDTAILLLCRIYYHYTTTTTTRYSIHPVNFGTHVTVRPTVRLSAPQTYQCKKLSLSL